MVVLAGGLCGAPACTFDSEPLRAGWLASGVYPQPPEYQCPPPQPPGRPYRVLSSWQPPSIRASAQMQLSLPWSGTFRADVRRAGSTGRKTRVSSRASRPVRIVEERGVTEQIPGFVAGVDVRGYRRIAFIADTSGPMCRFVECPGERGYTNIPAVQLQTIGDQIDAAVAGLRANQWFVVYGGSAWRSLRFQPTNRSGRALAGQFVRGQVCTGARGIRQQFQQALSDSPDVIVLLTSGSHQRTGTGSGVREDHSCAYQPGYLYCYVDQETEAVAMTTLAGRAAVPPVIAVSVTRHDATWLQNLAEVTGGAYVELAP